MQFTGVDPTTNVDPDAGVQVTVIGSVPPVVVGGGKLTVCDPSTPWSVWSVGQVICNGGPTGVGRGVALPEQPAVTIRRAAPTVTHARTVGGQQATDFEWPILS
jgi:hypothetical protein